MSDAKEMGMDLEERELARTKIVIMLSNVLDQVKYFKDSDVKLKIQVKLIDLLQWLNEDALDDVAEPEND